MNGTADTIAAIATPPGRGGVGIIRVSGPAVPAVAERLLGRLPVPRRAEFHHFRDLQGRTIDDGLALYFPAPHSFTGEEVLELQGHGGPVVMDMLLSAVIQAGARIARPGEFSERAFLNDKIDLAQAEAIADLIDSASRQAARSAVRSLQGAFSRRIEALVAGVTDLRVYVESAIDFTDEEIDFLGEGDLITRLEALRVQLQEVMETARQGCLLREGMTAVLAGRPNAGKSSLLNALAGRERAIVTAIPGTTRDVLREEVLIDGMPLHIIDTAGLREGADPVEQEGIRRAWGEIEQADRILLLVDDQCGLAAEDRAILDRLPDGLALTVVRNKIDLTGHPPALTETALGPEVALSVHSGAGLDLLLDHLKQVMGYSGAGEGEFTARRRHLVALETAAAHLGNGQDHLVHGAGELVAEELRLTQRALGEITGQVTADDLLGRIFSTFCIGK